MAQMWLRRHSGSGLPDSKAGAHSHPSGPLRGWACSPAGCSQALGAARVVWGVVGAQARWRDVGTRSGRGEDVAVWKAFQEEGSSRAKA